MENDQTKQQLDAAVVTVQGTFWAYFSYFSGKALSFLATVVLARLLGKEDFGVAAYALITISFLDMMSDLGIGMALIFHKEDYERSNTAFWLGLGIGLALFGIMYAGAPLAALVFHDARAIPVIQLLSLTYPISALFNVHDSLLSKRLRFGKKVIPDFFRAVSKGLFSILLAFLGFGPWSLIWGQLAGSITSIIPYWWICKFRPSFRFEKTYVRPLLSYGLKMVVVNALAVVSLNIDYLFVGRFLGAAALGVYTVSFRIPEILIKQFCTMIGKVIFPLYTRIKHDEDALSTAFVATLRYVVMITVPCGTLLVLLAGQFVHAAFSDKWMEAVPVLQAVAVLSVLRSLTFNAGDVYKAQGRVSQLSWLSALQLAINIPLLYWAATVEKSMGGVAWVQAIVAFFTGYMKLIVAARILKVPMQRLVSAMIPSLVGAIFLTLAVLASLIAMKSAGPTRQLIVCSVVGLAAYVGSLYWLNRDMIVTAGQTLRAAFLQRT